MVKLIIHKLIFIQETSCIFYIFALSPLLLTSADVHDMVEGVFALHNVHHQFREAEVVLGEQGVDSQRLDHIIHQEESLGILEAALCQVPSRTTFL